ncbi:hypothetical protein ACF0H5_012950 [Mactra antiquata]
MYLDWRVIWIKCSFIVCSLFQYFVVVFPFDGPLPSFTNTPQHVIVSKGAVAILRCGVENLGTKTVSWRKLPYNVPITVGKSQFLEIDRFKLVRVLHLEEWNLSIKNAQIFDSGTYECQVSLKSEKIRRNITLTVLESTTVQITPSIHLSGTQIVEKGSPIRLTCNATGDDSPPQSIDWFKDGSRLQTSYANQIYIHQHVSITDHAIASTLDIDKARMSDMGLYVCRASRNLATRMQVDVLNAETNNKRRETPGGLPSGYSSASCSAILTSSLISIVSTLLLCWLHQYHMFSFDLMSMYNIKTEAV